MRRSEGSVATIFAVSLVPVMIAAGIGIDMSRAMSSRNNLQDALDATALALAHLPTTTSQAALNAKVATWMTANLHDANMTAPAVTATLTQGQIVLNATSKVKTTLTAIAGYQEIPIAAHSTVKWGIGKIEVALVLDNTGSMGGTKLTRLKDAAEDLVEALEDSVAGDDPTALKIGLVPFSISVRLSSSSSQLNTYKSATWMKGVMPSEYGDDLFVNNGGNKLTNVNRFTMFDNVDVSWGGCVETRPAPYDIQDTAPNSATPATLFVPYFAPDEPDDYALRKNNWSYYDSYNDYLDDERDDDDAKDKVGNDHLDRWRYMQGFSGKYDEDADTDNGRGPNYGCNMQSLVRLTTNMTTIKDKIDDMNATGNTNIPIGLMWGWHVLSPNAPFADGVAYTEANTKKIIVLLTDGDNVYGGADNPSNSLYTTLGYAWQNRMAGVTVSASSNDRSAAMDTRLGLLCTNIKNAGITVYTVRIDLSGSASTALRDCATSTDMYYDIDSSGLSTAFADIAGSIGKLRIAQ